MIIANNTNIYLYQGEHGDVHVVQNKIQNGILHLGESPLPNEIIGYTHSPDQTEAVRKYMKLNKYQNWDSCLIVTQY